MACGMAMGIPDNRELISALKQAVEVIKGWHNMDGSTDDLFKLYYENAPEMKFIRDALEKHGN
jgi:hypothetical protein